MNIEGLIRRLVKGDESAFKQLVLGYTQKLMTVAKIYANSTQEAEDNLQDTFIVVLDKISEFKGQEDYHLYGWMKQILIYKSLNKSQKKYKRLESSLEVLQEPTTLHADAISQLSHQEIIDLVYNLPEGYKQVFALYVLEGYSHKEIGQRMGIGESSSRSQFSRAKKILQKKINSISKVYL